MSIRVLVAEDNLALSHVLRVNLQMSDFDVTITDDGQTAWEHCQRESFDLIITDQQMPSMTGLELCRKLETLENYVNIPIILLTASAFSSEVQAASIEMPSLAIISKPFSPRLLVTTVRKMLKDHHQNISQ